MPDEMQSMEIRFAHTGNPSRYYRVNVIRLEALWIHLMHTMLTIRDHGETTRLVDVSRISTRHDQTTTLSITDRRNLKAEYLLERKGVLALSSPNQSGHPITN